MRRGYKYVYYCLSVPFRSNRQCSLAQVRSARNSAKRRQTAKLKRDLCTSFCSVEPNYVVCDKLHTRKNLNLHHCCCLLKMEGEAKPKRIRPKSTRLGKKERQLLKESGGDAKKRKRDGGGRGGRGGRGGGRGGSRGGRGGRGGVNSWGGRERGSYEGRRGEGEYNQVRRGEDDEEWRKKTDAMKFHERRGIFIPFEREERNICSI